MNKKIINSIYISVNGGGNENLLILIFIDIHTNGRVFKGIKFFKINK